MVYWYTVFFAGIYQIHGHIRRIPFWPILSKSHYKACTVGAGKEAPWWNRYTFQKHPDETLMKQIHFSEACWWNTDETDALFRSILMKHWWHSYTFQKHPDETLMNRCTFQKHPGETLMKHRYTFQEHPDDTDTLLRSILMKHWWNTDTLFRSILMKHWWNTDTLFSSILMTQMHFSEASWWNTDETDTLFRRILMKHWWTDTHFETILMKHSWNRYTFQKHPDVTDTLMNRYTFQMLDPDKTDETDTLLRCLRRCDF